MHRLSFGKRHMVQVKLAILFNNNFRMERLHNKLTLTGILRFYKRGKAALGRFTSTGKPLKRFQNVSRPAEHLAETRHVFSVGSAGDSPSGTETTCRIGKLAFFCCVTPIPPGESPGRTGKLPVPPTLNTYEARC